MACDYIRFECSFVNFAIYFEREALDLKHGADSFILRMGWVHDVRSVSPSSGDSTGNINKCMSDTYVMDVTSKKVIICVSAVASLHLVRENSNLK